jgi:CspA family cold shock protein
MSEDVLLRCGECGISFVWTIGEQAAGPRPELCPMCRRLAPPPGHRRGVIKWFSRARGYGFIAPIEGPDLFVHKSGLAAGQPLPRAGQLVEFAIAQTSEGMRAVEVKVLEAPE